MNLVRINNMKIGSTRKDYKIKKKIIIKDNDPILTFDYWYKKASKTVSEPNAFCLSTISGNNAESRMMLLKDYGNKFTFFTNIKSRKGSQILKTKKCSMNFWWKEIHQQVRISGNISKLQNKLTMDYFYSRPKESQIAALISNQSRVIKSYDILIKRYKNFIKEYKNKEVPFPSNWVGFEINPLKFEFWQGGEFRLHQRVEFIKVGKKWKKNLLAP